MKILTNKLLFIATLIAFLASSITSVNATETRVGSMGGVGFYIKDNSNIFFFPGTINQYSNQVIMELRVKNDDNSYTVGSHFGFGGNSIIGLYLNRPLSITPQILGEYGLFSNISLDYTTDFLIGMPVDGADVGFRLTIGRDGFENDYGAGADDDVKESAFYLGFGAGLSYETMDIGLSVEIPRMKQKIGNQEVTWSGIGFGSNFRGFFGDEIKFVPAFTVNQLSTRAKEKGEPEELKLSTINLGFGVGLNYTLNENNMLVIAFEGYGIFREKIEDADIFDSTYSVTTIPGLYIGVESQIASWLTGRAGAAQVYQKVSEEYKYIDDEETIKSSTSSSQYKVSFGLAVNVKSFILDLSFNEGLLFDGPSFISNSNERLADKISLTYKF